MNLSAAEGLTVPAPLVTCCCVTVKQHETSSDMEIVLDTVYVNKLNTNNI